MQEDKLQGLAEDLHEIGAVKFGNYKTKIGINTPVYFDLRVIVSYPRVMDKIADILCALEQCQAPYDHVCGVPYTALPIATLVAVKSGRSMLMRRKEAKDYGTKKLIEGDYEKGQTCLIIEDVVTSGSSIMETAESLRNEGIVVSEAVVILNREQGGKSFLFRNGVRMNALFTLTDLVERLIEAKRLDSSVGVTVSEYLKNSQVGLIAYSVKKPERMKMTFEARSELTSNAITKQLFNIMTAKESNLCIAIDLTTTAEVLKMIELTGPYVCLVKLHVDIIEDFNDEFIKQLTESAEKYNFLLMEDRKYSDIGNTVALQYSKGLHKVVEWAHFVTAHTLSGVGVLDGLAKVVDGRNRGVFLVAEMSSEGNLITSPYTAATVSLAASRPGLAAGLVCQQGAVLTEPGLLQLTPGVQAAASADELGQTYRGPDVVVENGADIAVVGRGITSSADPGAEAQTYRRALWQAYKDRLQVKA